MSLEVLNHEEISHPVVMQRWILLYLMPDSITSELTMTGVDIV